MLIALSKRIPLDLPSFGTDMIFVIFDNNGLQLIFLDFEPVSLKLRALYKLVDTG